MADCVALQHRIKARTPLLQWADPPDDSVATEAYRMLTARMNVGQHAKAKLHVYNPLTGAQLTLKSATELCANVEKALHMDAKRKAADDGGSPASKRSANFNLLDCPEGPKNGSSTSSNASNPAEAGSFMNADGARIAEHGERHVERREICGERPTAAKHSGLASNTGAAAGPTRGSASSRWWAELERRRADRLATEQPRILERRSRWLSGRKRPRQGKPRWERW
jgi:hypothetical protein